MTLVLLPGMDGTGQLFAPLVAALGAGSEVKIVTYPTLGTLGYAELEAIARASVPTHSPFVLLGESFSGPIAISLAASSPRNLKGLILCCSFVRNPQPTLSCFRYLLGPISFKHIPISIISFFLLGSFATTNLRAALTQTLSQVTPEALRARLEAVSTVDVSAKLAHVTVPVLCLSSLHDRVVPQAATTKISRLVPTARLAFLDAPHFMLQAKPEAAANEIELFLRDIGVASP